MAREVINVGAAPNDGQGDPIRTSFIKTNNNFGELYARAQENPPATLVGSLGDFAGMYAYDSQYFYYCFADYDGSSTIWAEIPNAAIESYANIVNGDTTVSIPSANANVVVSVDQVSNVAVFTTTGLQLSNLTTSGDATIFGDLTVYGNANLSGNIVGDRIVNGTSSIEIPAANGNITVSVAGTSNVSTFTQDGISGNIIVPNGSKYKGDFTANVSNGRSVFQTTNTGATAPTLLTAIPGINHSGNIGAVIGGYANVDVANSTTINMAALDTQSRIQSLGFGSAPPVPIVFGFEFDTANEAVRITTDGNVGIGNVSPADVLAVTGNAYVSGNLTANNLVALGVISANTINGTSLSITGNVIGGNINSSDVISAAGNITTSGGIFIGNGSGLTGVVAVGNVGAASQVTNGTTNLNIPISNGNIIGNVGGVTNLFEFSTVGFSAAGNVTANNAIANSIVVAGNVTSTSGVFTGDGSGLINVIANVGSAVKILSGTTEINIPVSNGNIVANVGGVTDLFQWSTVGFSAVGNITGGNLRTGGLISATGNITGGNLRTGGLISATGNITGGNLSVTNIVGTLTTAAQTNVTSLGTLSSLNSSGAISAAGNVTGANVITAGIVSSAGNITGGNLLTAGLVSSAGNITGGNLLTAGLLSVTGNITAGNLSVNTGTVSLGAIINNNANGVGNIGTTTTRFNTVFALASSAQYADLAEYYLSDKDYEPGTVMRFGGSQEVTQCDSEHDVAVAGVVSANPAFEMNAGLSGPHRVALALAGRVACKIKGPVRRGQMLVSAGNGHARAESAPSIGAVIGKALQDFTGDIGVIEVVVGRL